ncbi:hypothetical protein, partial [Morganella morganii]|uniref:hypothetical protein n=1 Tax=Morganella morganii TaxID=582 RepID=UPI0015F44E4C
ERKKKKKRKKEEERKREDKKKKEKKEKKKQRYKITIKEARPIYGDQKSGKRTGKGISGCRELRNVFRGLRGG